MSANIPLCEDFVMGGRPPIEFLASSTDTDRYTVVIIPSFAGDRGSPVRPHGIPLADMRPRGELLQPVPHRAAPRGLRLRRRPPPLLPLQGRHSGISSG